MIYCFGGGTAFFPNGVPFSTYSFYVDLCPSKVKRWDTISGPVLTWRNIIGGGGEIVGRESDDIH